MLRGHLFHSLGWAMGWWTIRGREGRDGAVVPGPLTGNSDPSDGQFQHG